MRSVWHITGTVLVLLWALAFVFLEAHLRSRQADVAGSVFNTATGLPRPDAKSPTGFEHGMRVRIPSLMGVDGAWWKMHAQTLAAEGSLRVRETAADNPPTSREVHWSSGLMWILVVVGWLVQVVAGGELGGRIESVGDYFPILSFLASAGLIFGIFHRRLGMWPCALWVAGMTAVFPVYQYFLFGSLDHHGMALVAGLVGAMLLAVAGFRGSNGILSDRRVLIVAGFFTAAGLWVSAASQIPLLVGLAGGFLAALTRNRWYRHVEDGHAMAGRWRVWGYSSAAFSLLFYAIEYFPFHMGWRLEVNHPLYALALAGAGEVMAWLSLAIPVSRRREWITSDGLSAGAGAVAILLPFLLPFLAVLLLPEKVFWVADPFLYELHRAFIQEFQPFREAMRKLPPWEAWAQSGLLPLVAIPVAWLVVREKTPPGVVTTLGMLTGPALVFSFLSLLQIRWTGFAYGFWLLVLVFLVVILSESGKSGAANKGFRWVVAAIGVAALLPFPLWASARIAKALTQPPGLSTDDQQMLVMRDVAHRLRGTDPEPPAVLSGPSANTLLAYFGGLRVLGTFYWENLPGLRAAARLYNTPDPEAALEALQRHGISRIAVFSWDVFAEQYAHLDPSRASPGGGFLQKLVDNPELPVWIRPIAYKIPPQFQLPGQWVRLFEIHPSQGVAEALFHVGVFQDEMGEPDVAVGHFEKALRAGAPPDVVLPRLVRSLLQMGAVREVEALVESLLPPQRATAFFEAASALKANGHDLLCVAMLRKSLQADPGHRQALFNLLWMLAASRDFETRDAREALRLAEGLLLTDLSPGPEMLDAIAAAHAEAGDFSAAVELASRAIEATSNVQLRQDIEQRREGYRKGIPHRLAE